MKNFILPIIVLSLSLSGCGGGGGGSPARAASGVTAAQVAGTWKLMDFDTVYVAQQGLCSGATESTVILNANGTYTTSFPAFTLFCISGTLITTAGYQSGSGTGTFTVNPDGSATISSSGGTVYNLQFSKDLSTATYTATTSSTSQMGTALRM